MTTDQRQVAMDLVTATVGVCAITVTILLVVAWLSGSRTRVPERPNREVADWRTYATVGNRVGPADAPVTIVAWGDYECPACAAFERNLRQVMSMYHDEVAVVHRHWPLESHRYAYTAARAAECAAVQGRFAEFHAQLFENPNWIGDAFERFADNADVPDMDRFRACNRDTSPVASIERDIEAVKRLGGWGTPTVLLNGTQLGEIPGLKDLEDLIAAAVGATQR